MLANIVTGLRIILSVALLFCPICLVATFAAIQEGHFIRAGKEKQ